MCLRSLVLAAGLLAAGCAPVNELDDLSINRIDANILPGRDYVARHCRGCHAVNPTGDSPYDAAPRFRSLAGASPAQIYQAVVHASGNDHYGMPRIIITQSEANQITAYIHALNSPDKRLRRSLVLAPCIATTPC